MLKKICIIFVIVILSSIFINSPLVKAQEVSNIFSISPNEYKAFELNGNKIKLDNNSKNYLTDKEKQAITKAPLWLQDELKKQFNDLENRPIDIKLNLHPATGDINKDKYNDIVVGGEKGYLAFFLNNQSRSFDFIPSDKEKIDLSFCSDLEIKPSIFDINNDGFSDIFFGAGNKLFLFINNSDLKKIKFNSPQLIFESQMDKDSISPFVFGLGKDNAVVIALGHIDGSLTLLRQKGDSWIEDKNFFKVWEEEWTEEGPERKGVFVSHDASPTITDLQDNSKLLVIGGGDGDLKSYRILESDEGFIIQNYDLNIDLNIKENISPAFFDINEDSRIDLIFGLKSGTLNYILNYGFNDEIKFIALSSGAEDNPINDYFGGIGYFRNYDPVYAHGYNQDIALKIIDYLQTVDSRYLDEVIYCISMFQVEDLVSYASLDLLHILTENAKSIYDIAGMVSYVRIKEYDDYTTLEYLTNDGLKEMPKEIYYKYLVMLNRYLSSPTAYSKYYDNNFYRTYLPNDNTYGKSLLDSVINSKTLNEAAYNVDYWLKAEICGIWHTGEKPKGWYNIYKNLLNKDVGIWCGEWSIIYEAAARAVNIPTVIIIALGEDHQFNNYWADGWHHIDSSSGSVGKDGSWKDFVDDSLIYYKTWGKRIFSWPMEWEANGKYDHVWRSELPYNPPELLSDLTFNVTDKKGTPIDGARIQLWSHWPMEGASPYAPVPFPSALGFTNSEGKATIKKVGHQNFTVYVVTRIGSVNFFIDSNSLKNNTYDIKIPQEIPQLYNYKSIKEPSFTPKEKIITIELRMGSAIPKINGEVYPPLEMSPYISGGRTMVPARFISEAFGARIEYDQSIKRMSITLKDLNVKLYYGNPKAIVNDKEVYIDPDNPDVCFQIKNGRSFLPLRFLAEIFGAEVKWESDIQEITIIYKAIEEYKVTNFNVKIENYIQKNFHWIDAYNTVLKYTDYWEQDSVKLDCLVLSEKAYKNLISGNNIDKADYVNLNNAADIKVKLDDYGTKYFLLVYNPNFATSISFKITNSIKN